MTFLRVNAKAIAAFIVTSVAGYLAAHGVTLNEALRIQAQALIASFVVWLVKNKEKETQ